MRIGFDLDRIFISTPPGVPDVIIERLYRKKTNGTLAYRMPSEKEQMVRIFSHKPLFRPAIKKNIAFLKMIANKEDELFIISSRFGFLKPATELIIKQHHLHKFFSELHFNYENRQPHIFKHEVIKNLQLDKYVDDDLYLLKYIASRNNKTKLFWFNAKHNKKISNNITAITHLEDMLNTV